MGEDDVQVDEAEPPEDTPEVIAELTSIALEEYACHTSHDRFPVCELCGMHWPCGLRRWAENWLFGSQGRAEVLRTVTVTG
ncbi:hypothetical protein Lfu02_08270 [Longispora fulva]|uniref:Uncharacterized protein n=1 Tax=Longispora fulva TaxID=619741 RepID=A0A8J7KJC0_9ACTN|nr:hypothetical protein [Longispora fulva]MBG6135306.1 hypothetical protein [Longispora fulva]GIG56455.1 hypothetical protein Lfu02_08270 [Longispora fulva]